MAMIGHDFDHKRDRVEFAFDNLSSRLEAVSTRLVTNSSSSIINFILSLPWTLVWISISFLHACLFQFWTSIFSLSFSFPSCRSCPFPFSNSYCITFYHWSFILIFLFSFHFFLVLYLLYISLSLSLSIIQFLFLLSAFSLNSSILFSYPSFPRVLLSSSFLPPSIPLPPFAPYINTILFSFPPTSPRFPFLHIIRRNRQHLRYAMRSTDWVQLLQIQSPDAVCCIQNQPSVSLCSTDQSVTVPSATMLPGSLSKEHVRDARDLDLIFVFYRLSSSPLPAKMQPVVD